MRKLFVGIFAALAVIFLGGAPAFAATETWIPSTQGKQSSYYLEDSIPQDARNTIESALELAEIPGDSPRHLYVAKLPEGTNVQTAAREVAKAWELNKDEQSLILYDVTSGGTFIWPATEGNVSLAASVNGASSVDQFSTEIPSLFDGVSATQDEVNQAASSDKAVDILTWVVLAAMVIGVIIFAAALIGDLM